MALIIGSVKGQLQVPQVNTPSSKASDIMRTNLIPVGYYTGTVSPHIDLIKVELGGIVIPINLTYNSSGIKVEDNYSSVGAGWSLDVGGFIHRNVRGIGNFKRSLDDVVIKENPDINDFNRLVSLTNRDSEGDIFYFNINGYTGSFVFDNEGIVLIKHDPDIIFNYESSSRTFTMKDDRGNVYTIKSQGTNGNDWVLNSITNMDNTVTVTFEYITGGSSVIAPRNSNYYHFSGFNPHPYLIYNTPKDMYKGQGHGSLVSKITISDGSLIEFDYLTIANSSGKLALERISYYNEEGDKVKNVSFAVNDIRTVYEYQQPSSDYPRTDFIPNINYRLYLDKVVIKSVSNLDSLCYEMAYYGRTVAGRDSLPNRLSCAQDYYGYYNGKLTNTTLRPSINEILTPFLGNLPWVFNVDEWFPYTPINIPGGDRSVQAGFSQMGTLKSIKYPTGGKDIFEFEPNYDAYSSDNKGSGLRIKSIKSYDVNMVMQESRRFEYTGWITGYNDYPYYSFMFYNKDNPNFIYPFILENMPANTPNTRFGIGLEVFSGLKDDVFLFELVKNAYASVKEIYADNSYTVYRYEGETGYNEDYDNISVRALFRLNSSAVDYRTFHYGRFGWPMGPYIRTPLWKNGNLLSKSYYDSTRNLVGYEQNYYNYAVLKEIPSLKTLTMTSNLFYLYYPYKQLSTLTELDSTIRFRDGVKEKTIYEYTAQSIRKIRKQILKNSTSDNLITEYGYSFDKSGAPYQTLSTQNYLQPIEIKKYLGQELIERELLNYSLFGNIPRPNEQYTYKSGTMLSNSVTYLRYDTFGNPQEIRNKAGHINSFLWDYKGKYLIAEVQNAAFQDVAYSGFETNNKGNWMYSGTPSAVSAYTGKFGYQLRNTNSISKSGLNPSKIYQISLLVKGNGEPILSGGTILSTSSMPMYDDWIYRRYTVSSVNSISLSATVAGIFIDDVRLCPVDANMSTFTYIPLVGLTSVTDARGITEHYEYDGFQRLKKSLDFEKNMQKDYQYHYRP